MFKEKIEKKYKTISKLPDWLLAFTFPIREKAIELLQLKKGQSVMDVGCGTGASFKALRNRIGEEGHILAIDASSSMTRVALRRISNNNWNKEWGKVNIVCYGQPSFTILLYPMVAVLPGT